VKKPDFWQLLNAFIAIVMISIAAMLLSFQVN
jgi:arginine exporter protein ArgO